MLSTISPLLCSPAPLPAVVDLDADTFASDVMLSAEPWLIYFYEHGSKACRTFKPQWQGTASRLGSTPMRCGRVENTRAPDVLEDFHLQVLPAVVVRAQADPMYASASTVGRFASS